MHTLVELLSLAGGPIGISQLETLYRQAGAHEPFEESLRKLRLSYIVNPYDTATVYLVQRDWLIRGLTGAWTSGRFEQFRHLAQARLDKLSANPWLDREMDILWVWLVTLYMGSDLHEHFNDQLRFRMQDIRYAELLLHIKPFPVDLAERVIPKQKPFLANAALQHMQLFLTWDADMYDWIRRHADTLQFGVDLMLRGRFEEADRHLDNPLSMAWEASMAGDVNEAIELFKEQLEIERDMAGRKRAVDGPELFPYISTLMRSPDRRHWQDALTHLRQLSADAPVAAARTYFGQFIMWRLNKPGKAPSHNFRHPVWQRLAEALATTWMGEAVADTLDDLLLRDEAGGYLHLGEQIRALTHPLEHTWAAAVSKIEPWRRVLDSLSSIKPPPKAARAAPEQRLSWLLDSAGNIEPLIEKRDAQGFWLPGKDTTIARLRKEQSRLPFLLDQDRLVLTSGMVAFTSIPDKDKCFALLVGHPHLFRIEPPCEPITLEAGEPELIVHDSAEGFRLELQPMPGPDNRPVLVEDTHTQWRFVTFSPVHTQIAALLKESNIIPRHAADELQASLAHARKAVLVRLPEEAV